ncbi:hypothetical protein MKEN_01363900 [Mycena kentingensis (nom. inval.)]|nr:hypothetical protein MKEN_01363900 [Mycena kentingensis (nom. inval.)]
MPKSQSLSRPRSASTHPMAPRSNPSTTRPTTRSVSPLRASATSNTSSASAFSTNKSSSASARHTSGGHLKTQQRRFSTPLSSPVPKTPTRTRNTNSGSIPPLSSAPSTPEPKYDATVMDVVLPSPTRSCSAMSALSKHIQQEDAVKSNVDEYGQEGGVADTDGGDGKVVWRAENAGDEKDDADLQGAPGSPVEHTQSLAPPQYDAAYIESYLKSVQSAPTFEQPNWRSVPWSPSQGRRGYQSRSRRSIL